MMFCSTAAYRPMRRTFPETEIACPKCGSWNSVKEGQQEIECLCGLKFRRAGRKE